MKIAAYCRVSTAKEAQLDSLHNQKRFFADYAEKHGHELVEVYADEGISGTSLKKRGAFQRLLTDAAQGRFELVVVKDISRFARNTVDFLQSIRTLKSYGINTLFLTANMESLGESEFVLTVFGAMAQEESANLSRRVKFGKKINAKKGRVPQRVFGYDRMDNFTLEINPKEAQVVREIYALYLEKGLGCRTISLELNRLGHKTKLGCDWNPRAVRRVLTNSIYCGRYVNNKYEVEDYLTGRQVRLPQQEQFHHSRPEWAIVSRAVFDRAQEQLAQRRSQYDPDHRVRYSGKYPFSTLIKCAHCGRSFCRKQYKNRIYWKCTTNDQFTAQQCDNRVKLDEQELLAQLKGYFSALVRDREGLVTAVLSELRRRRPRPRKEGTAQKRNRLMAKKARYQELYANDLMTMAELKERTAEITRALNALSQQEQPPEVQDSRETVEQLLCMEAVTNGDFRRIIHQIQVSRDGTVRIILKK